MGVAAAKQHQKAATSNRNHERASQNQSLAMVALLTGGWVMGARLEQSERCEQQA